MYIHSRFCTATTIWPNLLVKLTRWQTSTMVFCGNRISSPIPRRRQTEGAQSSTTWRIQAKRQEQTGQRIFDWSHEKGHVQHQRGGRLLQCHDLRLADSVVDMGRGHGPWQVGSQRAVRVRFQSRRTNHQYWRVGSVRQRWTCGGPVKDSQRTKTHPGTIETLSIVWGTRDLEGHSRNTADWYSASRQCGSSDFEITPTAQVDPLE